MNRFKWLYCGQGKYIFEILTMLITYGIFRTLVYTYQWEWFRNLEIAVVVLSIAIGRFIFIIINYILHNKICGEYDLTSKMMSLGTSIILIVISLGILRVLNTNYENIQKNTKDIQVNQIKLYIYKGKKPNGNRRLKYDITIDKTLYIKDLKNDKVTNTNLSQNVVTKFQNFIKKLDSVESINNKGFSHPYDLNIDIRTSKNLIIFPLSHLKFVHLNDEEQKIIKDFLEFVKFESNNNIDLSHEFNKKNKK